VAHWFQGNNTEFAAFDDPPTACIAANFNNNSGIGTIVSGCSRLKQRLVRRRSAVGLKPAPCDTSTKVQYHRVMNGKAAT
jgi:hypothetical protein